ncbi:MAG: hypothetical protein Tsb0020_26140 [Haliangiales bacterium]
MSQSVVDLTNALLLGVIKKSPEAFRIRPAGETSVVEHVVEHLVAGEVQEELRAPTPTLTAVIRRLSVMANLPSYRQGEAAAGRIHLQVGDASHYFEIRVEGHGPELVLYGNTLSAAAYHSR